MFRILISSIPFTDKKLIIRTNEKIQDIEDEIMQLTQEWDDITKQLKNLNKYIFAKRSFKLRGKPYSRDELELLVRSCSNSPVAYVVNSLFWNHSDINIQIVDRTYK